MPRKGPFKDYDLSPENERKIPSASKAYHSAAVRSVQSEGKLTRLLGSPSVILGRAMRKGTKAFHQKMDGR